MSEPWTLDRLLDGSVDHVAGQLRRLRQDQPDDYRELVRQWTAQRYPELTPLERHVAVFDPDGDGVLDLVDTWTACRDMGGTRWTSLKATTITMAAIFRLKWAPWSMPISRVAELSHPAVHSGGFRADGTADTIDDTVAEMMASGGPQCPLKLGRNHIADHMQRVAGASSAPRAEVRDAGRISALEWPVMLDFTDGEADEDTLRSLFLGSLFFELLRPEALAARMVAGRSSAG